MGSPAPHLRCRPSSWPQPASRFSSCSGSRTGRKARSCERAGKIVLFDAGRVWAGARSSRFNVVPPNRRSTRTPWPALRVRPLGDGCLHSLRGCAIRILRMIEETISRRGNVMVRRLVLAPGEATPWHIDPFHRLTVIIRGDALAIEHRDGTSTARIEVAPGMSDWDEPTGVVHRGVNAGQHTY